MSALKSEFRCEECNTFFAMQCPACKKRACGNESCDDYSTQCHYHCDERGNFTTLVAARNIATPKAVCCDAAHTRAAILHSKCYKAGECLCGPCECDCHYL